MCVFEQNQVYRPMQADLISRLKNYSTIVHDSCNMAVVQALTLVAIIGFYLPDEFNTRHYISLAVQKSYQV